MNAETRGKPDPDDLAGIPVTHEETPPFVRPRRAGAKRRASTVPIATAGKTPTANDLAGIPVCVVAKEDCTVRPRRRR
jgi:hypothetical protein